jgi:hypothetical protein
MGIIQIIHPYLQLTEQEAKCTWTFWIYPHDKRKHPMSSARLHITCICRMGLHCILHEIGHISSSIYWLHTGPIAGSPPTSLRLWSE